jgi:hypothetical protein
MVPTPRARKDKEKLVTDPFWNRVIPTEKEIREIESEIYMRKDRVSTNTASDA